MLHQHCEQPQGAWGFRVNFTSFKPAAAHEGAAADESPPDVRHRVELSLRLPWQRRGGALLDLLSRTAAVMATTCDGVVCSWKPTPHNKFDWNRRFRYMRPHAADLRGTRLINLVDRFFSDDVYGSQRNLGFLFLYVWPLLGVRVVRAPRCLTVARACRYELACGSLVVNLDDSTGDTTPSAWESQALAQLLLHTSFVQFTGFGRKLRPFNELHMAFVMVETALRNAAVPSSGVSMPLIPPPTTAAGAANEDGKVELLMRSAAGRAFVGALLDTGRRVWEASAWLQAEDGSQLPVQRNTVAVRVRVGALVAPAIAPPSATLIRDGPADLSCASRQLRAFSTAAFDGPGFGLSQSAVEAHAGTTKPLLSSVGVLKYAAMLSAGSEPLTSSESLLPFDVRHHRDVNTVLGRELVRQMEADVLLRRADRETAATAQLLCLHQPHFDRLERLLCSPHPTAGAGKVDPDPVQEEATRVIVDARKRLGGLLAALKTAATEQGAELRRRVALIQRHANAVPSSEVQLAMKQLTGLVSLASFEQLAAVVLSTKAYDDLRSVNPSLSDDAMDQLLHAIAAVHLDTGRLTQLNRCVAGIGGLLKRLDGFVETALRSSWRSFVCNGAGDAHRGVPVTTEMVRWALQVSNFDSTRAQAHLVELCESSVALADSLRRVQEQRSVVLVDAHPSAPASRISPPLGLEDEQNEELPWDASTAIVAASLALHASTFDIAAATVLAADVDAMTQLVGRSQRGCCYCGARLVSWEALTAAIWKPATGSVSDPPSAARFSTSALRMVQLAAADAASSLLARRAYITAGDNASFVYDPRLLVFEGMCGFLLRGRQVELVKSFVATAATQSSCVQQMIMGAGKTTVVGPLLVWTHAQLPCVGHCPVSCVCVCTVMCCDVLCGVVWCGVVWCGLVWCSDVW